MIRLLHRWADTRARKDNEDLRSALRNAVRLARKFRDDREQAREREDRWRDIAYERAERIRQLNHELAEARKEQNQ